MRYKKSYEVKIDPRDPSRSLWEWLHADNHRRHVAPLSDEQIAQSSEGNREHARREREAWLTDMEVLTGSEDTS